MRGESPSRRGFTLVELLAVIGIISALVAILLPAMSAAREQARTVQCLSNLRQLAVAAVNYADAYDGSYPIAYYSDYQPPLSFSYNWDFNLTTDATTGQTLVVPGLLWQGSASAGAQQCPSFAGGSNTVADPYTGYNYNSSFVGGGKFISSVFPPAKMGNVRRSSRCALFGDGQFYNGADKFMRSPFPGPSDTFFGLIAPSAGTQGFRHRGKTNAAFCDGHAETFGDRFTQQSPLDPTPAGAGTGYLSSDNSLYDVQ